MGILTVVELASGLVMLGMAAARNATPGPETPLWRIAMGAVPSWIAAGLFGLAAATAAMLATFVAH